MKNKMKKFFIEIKKRWKSETPKFWKKVRKFAVRLIIAAAGIWTVNSTFGLGLPEIIIEVCKYAIAIGGAMGIQAQLTKTDSSN